MAIVSDKLSKSIEEFYVNIADFKIKLFEWHSYLQNETHHSNIKYAKIILWLIDFSGNAMLLVEIKLDQSLVRLLKSLF